MGKTLCEGGFVRLYKYKQTNYGTNLLLMESYETVQYT